MDAIQLAMELDIENHLLTKLLNLKKKIVAGLFGKFDNNQFNDI